MDDGDVFLIGAAIVLAPVVIGLMHAWATSPGPAEVMNQGEHLGSLEDVDFGDSACKITADGSEYVFSHQSYRSFTVECEDIRFGDPVYRYEDEIHVVKERWKN